MARLYRRGHNAGTRRTRRFLLSMSSKTGSVVYRLIFIANGIVYVCGRLEAALAAEPVVATAVGPPSTARCGQRVTLRAYKGTCEYRCNHRNFRSHRGSYSLRPLDEAAEITRLVAGCDLPLISTLAGYSGARSPVPGRFPCFSSLNMGHACHAGRHHRHGYALDGTSRPHLHAALRLVLSVRLQAPCHFDD